MRCARAAEQTVRPSGFVPVALRLGREQAPAELFLFRPGEEIRIERAAAQFAFAGEARDLRLDVVDPGVQQRGRGFDAFAHAAFAGLAKAELAPIESDMARIHLDEYVAYPIQSAPRYVKQVKQGGQQFLGAGALIDREAGQFADALSSLAIGIDFPAVEMVGEQAAAVVDVQRQRAERLRPAAGEQGRACRRSGVRGL